MQEKMASIEQKVGKLQEEMSKTLWRLEQTTSMADYYFCGDMVFGPINVLIH